MRLIRNILVLIVAFLALLPETGIASSLHVTWNANTDSDLAGYKVYYGTQSNTYGTPVPIVDAASYDIPNVQAGSTYYVAVSAYDSSNNESVKSAELSAYIPVSDTTPPTGSVNINSGDASTTSTTVTLTLSASDAAGTVTGMRFSNDGTNYAEYSYATSYSWTLSSGVGTKTVYVQFKDNSNNWMTSAATDTIQLVAPADTALPTGSVSINSGAASTTSTTVTLTLSASDATGTVTGMKFSNDGTTYSSEYTYAASHTWTLSSGYGTKTVYALFKDNSANWMTSPASDTINYVNAPPVANAGTNQNVAPDRVILDGSASSGQGLSYSWTQVSGTQVIIETPTASTASFMGIKAGAYQFRLTCTNSAGSSSATVNVTILNIAPSVNAGSNMTIDAGTQITLHATGQDPNEDNLTYQWTKVSSQSVTLPNMAQQDITFTPTIAGQYTFSVKCSDGVNTSTASQVIVTVNAVNRAPTANAGQNQELTRGSTVTLNGNASTDPDNDILTYSWVQASGPQQVTLTGANTAQPSFVAGSVGTYVFNLTVNDGKVNSTTSSVTITIVSQNTSPVANAGQDMHAYVGDDVVLDASGSYDPDLDGITFTWIQVSGASMVIHNNTSIQAFFTPTTSGAFEFKVAVSDGQATSTDNVIVTVDNANQVPIANAGSSIVAAVGQTITLDGSASYDPDGTSVSYIWSQTSGTQVSLSSSNAANPSFVAGQAGVYVFALKVYDGTDTSSSSAVTVTVQGNTTDVTLVSPANGTVCSTSPTLSWAGNGFKGYIAYISINGGNKYSKVYSGSKTSTTLHAVLWQWFIPKGTTVTWYVQGTTTSGQIIKSKTSTFIKK
jgi:hypothetical protein